MPAKPAAARNDAEDAGARAEAERPLFPATRSLVALDDDARGDVLLAIADAGQHSLAASEATDELRRAAYLSKSIGAIKRVLAGLAVDADMQQFIADAKAEDIVAAFEWVVKHDLGEAAPSA